MPTVLRIEGYRFFFYSNENDEPIHIHVVKADAEGKVWLEPEIVISWVIGFKSKEEKRILEIIQENEALIKSAWDEHFKNQ